MIIYGWKKEDLYSVVDYVNNLYAEFGGIPIEIRNLNIVSDKCRRGNQTLQFVLGFARPTRKRKDKYSPGIKYKLGYITYDVKDIIPFTEILDNHLQYYGYRNGKRRVWKEVTKSTGHLCWHMFGHFMTRLFDINPKGKIKTGMNVYDRIENFKRKASYNKFEEIGDMCECCMYGLEYFFNVDRNKLK